MTAWSKHPVAAAAFAMGIVAACTPTRGALYVLVPDGGSGKDMAADDAVPAIQGQPRCQANCAPLPVVVDDPGAFITSGYAGDWMGIKEVTSAADPAACAPARAHANAVGKCHHWTWKFSNDLCPVSFDPTRACPQWACVAWLKPSNLFEANTQGSAAGLAIAPGAAKVRFWAWAPAPTAVRFEVGSADEDLTASRDVQLTTIPQPFAIDIATATYDIVNRGFQWCNNDGRFDSLDFYVDDIQWTAGP